MSRERLTKRREAVEGPPYEQYPGTVNQPNREFKDWEEYHNFIQNVNHELPDMRTDWRDDERNDIGVGIPEPWGESPNTQYAPGTKAPTVTAPSSGDMAPTLASVRVSASKAVKLAVLLLGEKVAEDVVEEQANDFMMISAEVLDRTLARFESTQELYASDDDDADDDEEEAKEASDKSEEAKTAEAEDGKEEKVEEKVEEKAEEKTKEEKEASDKAGASKDEAEEAKADAEETKEAADKVADAELSNQLADDIDADGSNDGTATVAEDKSASSEMDIELISSSMDQVPVGEDDAVLASLFNGDVPAELPEPTRQASTKQGIKSLGGQPKIASSDGAVDISSLWDSAPDVSEVFN